MDERPTRGLTPIEGGKNKRRQAKDGGGDKPLKLAKTDLCEMVSGSILSRPGVFSKPFPLRLHVLQPNPSTRILLEEGDDGVVAVVPHAYIASAIVAWLEAERAAEYLVTYRTAVEIVDFWASCAPKLADADIAPLLWPGESGLTWQRLPWALAPGPAPTWEGVLARMSNSDAFCDFIGSLFCKNSGLHQYVWCQGQGNDGKGAINRFLERVFGRSYRSKHPPRSGDKFWTHGLIGARIVVLPDCDNIDFVRSGFFLALTGGDPVDVEAKGVMSGTVRLNCKFIIFSNKKPSVSSSHADQRRIIYCEFLNNAPEEPGFEDRLWDEGGAFLAGCLAGYLRRYPQHGAIKGKREQIQEIASGNEDEFQVAFDSFLIPVKTPPKNPDVCHTEASLNAFTVLPVMLQTCLKQLFPDRKTRSDFVHWMDQKHRVRKTGFWMAIDATSGEREVVYRYVGAVLKDPLRVYDYVNGHVRAPETHQARQV